MKLCGKHLQIAVKIRGLGRAVGRIVGRGLGKRDGDDFDGAPQRRRPTALALMQRVPITVANDVPAVPEAEPAIAGDEPMVDVDAQETGS